MAGIDIEVNEICNVLQAGEDSISSQRSKRRKAVEQSHDIAVFSLPLHDSRLPARIEKPK